VFFIVPQIFQFSLRGLTDVLKFSQLRSQLLEGDETFRRHLLVARTLKVYLDQPLRPHPLLLLGVPLPPFLLQGDHLLYSAPDVYGVFEQASDEPPHYGLDSVYLY
jgi:hypothetical protein